MPKSHITKIALSFDDGALDGYTNIFPLLKKYNLPATFNIVSGYLDQNTCGVEKPFPTLTWEMVREMSMSSLIEIANHSSNHTNKWYAIAEGRKEIISELKKPISTMIGFASPESKLIGAGMLSNTQQCITLGVSYVRTGMRIRSHNMGRIAARKIGRIMHLGWIYKIAYRDTLLDKEDNFFLYSVPVMKDTTTNQLIALIEYARSEDKNVIILLHRVKKLGEAGYNDSWSWDYGKFECLLQYLHDEWLSGHIEMLKTQDMIKQCNNSGTMMQGKEG